MRKYRKWIAAFLIIFIASAAAGIIYYRNATGGERRLSMIFIQKVVDGTNDFWTSLIFGTQMAAKEFNTEIEIMAPDEENDVEGQNRILMEAMEKQPDAILISPSSFTESDSLLQ